MMPRYVPRTEASKKSPYGRRLKHLVGAGYSASFASVGNFSALFRNPSDRLHFAGEIVSPDWKSSAFEGKILGHPAIFMNTNEFRSEVFDSVWDKDKYDVMCPFCLQPNGHVRFSIYTDKEGVKANEIAKRLGGGGHDKAAGFLLESPSDFMWFIKSGRDCYLT